MHSRYVFCSTAALAMGAKQGKYQEADDLGRRAIEITEAALGLDHPNLARNLRKRANALCEQVRERAGFLVRSSSESLRVLPRNACSVQPFPLLH